MPTYETTRFGVLEYSEDTVIELPDGLIGLPMLRRWLLLDMDQDVPMRWLQSLDRPDFGVPVMPPVFFAEEYTVGARRKDETGKLEDLICLIIATIHPGGERITGNLRAPLLIDGDQRRGAQIALDDDSLSTRQDMDYFKFGLAVSGEAVENEEPEAAAAEAAESEMPVPTY